MINTIRYNPWGIPTGHVKEPVGAYFGRGLCLFETAMPAKGGIALSEEAWKNVGILRHYQFCWRVVARRIPLAIRIQRGPPG